MSHHEVRSPPIGRDWSPSQRYAEETPCGRMRPDGLVRTAPTNGRRHCAQGHVRMATLSPPGSQSVTCQWVSGGRRTAGHRRSIGSGGRIGIPHWRPDHRRGPPSPFPSGSALHTGSTGVRWRRPLVCFYERRLHSELSTCLESPPRQPSPSPLSSRSAGAPSPASPLGANLRCRVATLAYGLETLLSPTSQLEQPWWLHDMLAWLLSIKTADTDFSGTYCYDDCI